MILGKNCWGNFVSIVQTRGKNCCFFFFLFLRTHPGVDSDRLRPFQNHELWSLLFVVKVLHLKFSMGGLNWYVQTSKIDGVSSSFLHRAAYGTAVLKDCFLISCVAKKCQKSQLVKKTAQKIRVLLWNSLLCVEIQKEHGFLWQNSDFK